MKNYISNEMKRFNYLLGEIEAVYHELFFKLGLSDSAAKILYTICDEGDGCLLREVRRHSGLSKQTVNSAIRKMETEKILFLEQADSKNKRVHLTEEGKQLAQRTVLRVIKAENEIFSSWSEADVEKYLALTENYLNALKEKAPQI